jgi:hypothetical protein
MHMPDYLRTALLLEEKAAKLPRAHPQRIHLLGLAKATRQVALDQMAAERKQGIIDRLKDQALSQEEAEFLYEIAVRFGRRGFYLHEISDMLGGNESEIRRMVFGLHRKTVIVTAVGEEDTAFGLDVPFCWIVAQVEGA